MCFSPEKHAALKRKFECSSPVKVNKYNLKKNDKTGEEELIWNKKTKIEEPQESEMEFDLQPIKAETVEAKDSSAEEILGEQIKTLVNIAGRVTVVRTTCILQHTPLLITNGLYQQVNNSATLVTISAL